MLVTLVVLGIAELGTRILLGDSFAMLPRYHTAGHYGEFTLRRTKPGSEYWHTTSDGRWRFSINNQGFRDDHDYSLQKLPEVVRVLVLGDSITHGYEMNQEEIYPKIIERSLIRAGTATEVLNTGVSGYSTAEELLFLENEGVRYDPDVVVLGIFGNDFDDNVRTGLFGLEDGRLVVRKTEYIPGVAIMDLVNAVPPLRWLSENSRLYSFGMNVVWDAAKSRLLAAETAGAHREQVLPSGQLDAYQKELMLALLRRMDEFCRSRGIWLVLVDLALPDDTDGHTYRSSIPSDITDAVANLGDAYISAEQVLGTYDGLTRFHVPRGHRHMNEIGHLLYGTAISNAIRELPLRGVPLVSGQILAAPEH
ncbi:MAG TPA: GDSL-type esterase/lipase family protein [Geminicoccaceae bacterium]|nr:GDSL-type esterase/lipase family protein [Geminicoccaceae bacterium]